MSNIRLRNVTKRFGDTVTLNNVNLSIEDGEFAVFVGPSGCGKSTMLRMIAGLEEVSEGEVLIGDEVMNDVAPAHRGVSMVFQSYALYPHMTVAGQKTETALRRSTPARGDWPRDCAQPARVYV